MNADELNLITLAQRFADDDAARAYLENLLWGDGPPCCPFCKSEGYRIDRKESAGRKAQRGVCKCRNKECRKQFTVTKGTVFESSHVKISTWLMCMFIMCASKKAVSAHQIHRMLGVTYKTAWFMCHRIRYAMAEGPLGSLLKGTIEVDETYVGGKVRGKGRKAGWDNKTPVVTLVERGGNKRSVIMHKVTAKNLRAAVVEHVEPYSFIHTDEHKGYKNLKKGFQHASLNHSAGEYVRLSPTGRTVTTNTVESSFALLKRGIVGAFHHVSKHHLHRYLAEFDFRWRAELLQCRFSKEEYAEFLRWLDLPNVEEANLNPAVSEAASEIRNFYTALNEKDQSVPRISLADAMIIATAVVWDCSALYTYDGDREPPSKPRNLLGLKRPVAGRYDLIIMKPDSVQLGM